MASELDVRLDKVENPALRADLKRQVELLRSRRRFGLVFEEHLPERVQLPEHVVRRGTRVVLRDHENDEPREVVKVAQKKATLRASDGNTEPVAVDELVVVGDFGEPIYPGLRRLGSLKAGGDKPAQVVIKGENHHVLEALQFTAKVGDSLRALDLLDPKVRAAVRVFEGGKVTAPYESAAARDYV